MKNRPTLILEKEHHLIQQMVGGMAAYADRIVIGEQVEKETLSELVEFMRVFVKRCHHEKEDKHLFPFLVKKGVPVAGCPIGALIHEHQVSEKLTADLGAAVDGFLNEPGGAADPLVLSLRAIVTLYPGHIWKENFLLFPMTDKILDAKEQQGLVKQFEMVERDFGPAVHQRFELLAKRVLSQARGAS